MSHRGQITVVLAFLFLAAILQGRAAHALSIWGAQPDFPLIVLACGANLIGGESGAVLGLFAGLLTASLVGLDYGSYLTSRTLAGAVAGWLKRLMIRDSVITPFLVVLATTIVAESVFVLMAPAHSLHTWPLTLRWIHSVLGGLVYNIVLAYPLYIGLRKYRIGQAPSDPFSSS